MSRMERMKDVTYVSFILDRSSWKILKWNIVSLLMCTVCGFSESNYQKWWPVHRNVFQWNNGQTQNDSPLPCLLWCGTLHQWQVHRSSWPKQTQFIKHYTALERISIRSCLDSLHAWSFEVYQLAVHCAWKVHHRATGLTFAFCDVTVVPWRAWYSFAVLIYTGSKKNSIRSMFLKQFLERLSQWKDPESLHQCIGTTHLIIPHVYTLAFGILHGNNLR